MHIIQSYILGLCIAQLVLWQRKKRAWGAQYGFVLFMGVAFDTFVVRTVVVPAVVTILSWPNLNW